MIHKVAIFTCVAHMMGVQRNCLFLEAHFPAEGRTFLRTLRNLKPCVYVFLQFFQGFSPGLIYG